MLTVSAAVTDILCWLVCKNLHSYTKFSLAWNLLRGCMQQADVDEVIVVTT